MSENNTDGGIFGWLKGLFKSKIEDGDGRNMRGNTDDRQMRGNTDDRNMRGNTDDR